MVRKTRFAVAAAAIAAIAAGGTAYTNSNTMPPDQVVGYGTMNVTGATVNSIHYNLNSTGDNVDTVTLVLAGNTTASAVSISLDGGAATSCGTGTFATDTTYTCDNGGSHFTELTSDLSSTSVIVQ